MRVNGGAGRQYRTPDADQARELLASAEAGEFRLDETDDVGPAGTPTTSSKLEDRARSQSLAHSTNDCVAVLQFMRDGGHP